MTVVIVVAALAVLALVTQACLAQRARPAQGGIVEVAGATLHVLDIGPRDVAGPPIVMLHGASSNLEVMRQPVGERLARKHRVILIDRPGHGWSTRVRLEDSTPEIQARMIEEALAKLGVNQRDLCGAFLGRRAGRAYRAGLPASRRRPRDAGAGGLSVARRRRALQQADRHAGDRPAIRLHHHAAARPFAGGTGRAQRVPAADDAGWICPEHRHPAVAAAARIHRQCARSGDAEGGGRRAGAALRARSRRRSPSSPARPTRRCRPTSTRARSRLPRRTQN